MKITNPEKSFSRLRRGLQPADGGGAEIGILPFEAEGSNDLLKMRNVSQAVWSAPARGRMGPGVLALRLQRMRL
ncbi:MAG: hypothetical protein ACLPX7_27730 [Xanthobacteraceae bacterium]